MVKIRVVNPLAENTKFRGLVNDCFYLHCMYSWVTSSEVISNNFSTNFRSIFWPRWFKWSFWGTTYQFVERKIGFITLGKLLSIKISGENSFHPNPKSNLTRNVPSLLLKMHPYLISPQPKMYPHPNFTLTQNWPLLWFDPYTKFTLTPIRP